MTWNVLDTLIGRDRTGGCGRYQRVFSRVNHSVQYSNSASGRMPNFQTNPGLLPCLAIVLLLVTGTDLRSQEIPDAVKTCLEAWKRREQAVRSLRVEWTEQEVQLEELQNPLTGESVDGPTEFENQYWWTIRDDWQKFGQRRGYFWTDDAEDTRWEPTPPDAYHEGSLEPNGKATNISHPGGKLGGENYPYATIVVSSHSGSLNFLPIAAFCRQGNSWFNGHLEYSLATVEAEATANGHSCVVFSVPYTPPGSPTARRQYWVVPELDWSVTRVTSTTQGHQTSQIDIDFAVDKSSGLAIPTGWKIVKLRDTGEIRLLLTAKVSRYELNPVVTDEDLHVKLPDGGFLKDFRDPGGHYFIHSGGQLYELPANLRGATYENIVKMALREGKSSVTAWLMIGVVVFAFVAAVLAWKRYSVGAIR